VGSISYASHLIVRFLALNNTQKPSEIFESKAGAYHSNSIYSIDRFIDLG